MPAHPRCATADATLLASQASGGMGRSTAGAEAGPVRADTGGHLVWRLRSDRAVRRLLRERALWRYDQL